MKIIWSAIILLLLVSCTTDKAKNLSKKETEKMMQNAESVEIKHNEEKLFFSSLKIKFTGFSHEHASSGPEQSFSATVGVYFFKVSDEKNEKEMTVYTSSEGRSNAEKIFDKYELTLEKATPDQKTLTMSLRRIP